MLEKGIAVPPPNSNSLLVVIAGDGAEIAGIAPAHSTVLLIPDRAGLPQLDLNEAVQVETDGTFRILGVKPGKYHAIAISDYGTGAESNPGFIERVKNHGTTLTVTAGARITIELK